MSVQHTPFKQKLRFTRRNAPAGVLNMKTGQQFLAKGLFTVSGVYMDEFGMNFELQLDQFEDIDEEAVADENTRNFLMEISKGGT